MSTKEQGYSFHCTLLSTTPQRPVSSLGQINIITLHLGNWSGETTMTLAKGGPTTLTTPHSLTDFLETNEFFTLDLKLIIIMKKKQYVNATLDYN